MGKNLKGKECGTGICQRDVKPMHCKKFLTLEEQKHNPEAP